MRWSRSIRAASVEDVFPQPPGEENPDDAAGPGALVSAVDTTRIQSYQVRVFVEALRGIREDIGRAPVSAPAIRLALVGPVSPVALAREVRAAVERGDRSPTAAGFQLIELLACLATVERDATVPAALADCWAVTMADARARIESLLQELGAQHPALVEGKAFQRYRQAILSNAAGKRRGS